MRTISSYKPYLLLLFCIVLLLNCKSDVKKSTPADSETPEKITAKVDNDQSTEVVKQIEKPDSSKVIETSSSTPQKPKPTKTKTKPVGPNQNKPSIQVKEKKPAKAYVAKKPKIEFEETSWNFGEITEGDIVEKKFKFTNTGKAPLQILATSASCGCTIPSFPFLDIAPGESNVIGVTYNSVSKEGKQTPEITIESNTEPKVTILKLYGYVKPKPKNEENTDSAQTSKDSITAKQF